jgi:hypothetical protein
MKKFLLLGIFAGLLTFAAPAQARGHFSVNIGVPGVSVHIGSAPRVYLPPPPIYIGRPACAPPAVVVAPPVCVRPPRVILPPRRVVFVPPPSPVVVYRPHHHYVAGPFCR